MSKTALFIKHRALPGKRDEVRRVWEKYLRPSIITNMAHETYVYCYDDGDPDTICVFQLYASHASSQEFLKAPWYAAYLKEVTPLLAGEPEIRTATPVWAKGAFI
jgi:quinol monooxygenase YgiN